MNRGFLQFGRYARLIGSRLPTRSRWALARRLVTRANSEREAQNYHAASALYEEALRLAPRDPRFLMQYGHMLKEAGNYAAAEDYYGAAAGLLPDDPDVTIQLGHFYKVAGRSDDAQAAYSRAAELRPGWREAQQEAAALGVPQAQAGEGADRPVDDLVPEILPRARPSASGVMREGFFLRRLGAARVRRRGAFRRALRGIEAIHGFIVSWAEADTLTIRIDGNTIRQEPLSATLQLDGGQSKYVFNVWHDFSGLAPGPVHLELRAARRGRPDLVHAVQIEIAPPVDESEYPQSDAIVDPFFPDGRRLEEQINARASMVRPAARGVLSRAPRAILVQRADQLGDLVCSIPAFERLRSLFPSARLVALVTAANADLARTLDMLDDVIVVDFPEAPDGHKSLALADQQRLRRQLASFDFDVAIDLGETSASRPLLLLSGAPFLYGFKDREFPWLTAGFELNTHDPANHGAMAATAHKLVAMVDSLGEIIGRDHYVLKRQDLDQEVLEAYGIGPTRPFAVLHTGARLAYSRWPGFAELAAILLDRTDLQIVVMSDGEPLVDIPESGRVTRITDRLPFDVFDSLLSFCALFVGNDSGPKHLASLRGAPVVSLHMARLNWNEWGQEASGVIVSRRVPCAGCGIAQNAEDCGKEFACLRHITPEEVFEAASRLLAPAAGAPLQSAHGSDIAG